MIIDNGLAWIREGEQMRTATLGECAGEIYRLQEALRRAVHSHGHRRNCPASRGMSSDCTCGWMEVKRLSEGLSE